MKSPNQLVVAMKGKASDHNYIQQKAIPGSMSTQQALHLQVSFGQLCTAGHPMPCTRQYRPAPANLSCSDPMCI